MIHYDIDQTIYGIHLLCDKAMHCGEGAVSLDPGVPVVDSRVDCPECCRRFDRLHRDTAFIAPKPAVTMDDEGMVWA